MHLPGHRRGVAGGCLVVALAVLVFLVGTVRVVSPTGSFAYGCDGFGYQRQAELIRSRGLPGGLDTRIESADGAALIALARDAGVSDAGWQRVLGPHCHHVDAHSGRIIAQYPPGTPLVLSIFPPGTAGYGAYLVLAFGTCLAGLLFLTLGMPSFPQVVAATLFAMEAARYFFIPASWASFSVGITAGFVLLLTSLLLGWPASRARATLFCAGFGALAGVLLAIRLPNVFVILGLGIALLGRLDIRRPSALRRRWPELLAGAAAFLVTGPALIAAGNRLNTGSLLHTTYGTADASAMVWSQDLLLHHLRFYFLSCDSATLVDMSLAIVVLSVIVALGAAATPAFRWATAAASATMATSILFFLTHEITAPYYLVPGAIFSLAILATTVPYAHAGAWLPRRPLAASVGVGLLVVAAAYRMPRTKEWPPFSFSVPQEVLAPGAVVWSDFTSGTLLYYNGKLASKLPFGTACERLALVASARRAGAAQYLIDDSPGMHDVIAGWMGTMVLKRIGDYDVFAPQPVWRIEDAPGDAAACR